MPYFDTTPVTHLIKFSLSTFRGNLFEQFYSNFYIFQPDINVTFFHIKDRYL